MTYIICKSSIQTSVRMKCLESITPLHVSHPAVCMDGCNFIPRCSKKNEKERLVHTVCTHTKVPLVTAYFSLPAERVRLHEVSVAE